jgi:bifunctional non-homologous end joining protein LigD
MDLDLYRKKRDFERTPEPRGKLGKPTGRRLTFVIQKHAASRLHYDFRLELNGVLLSWAVPKGPSLDPNDKRLAMHVEDHPIEYGTFEGVIPDGYGAGIVMLWDEGTWEPLVDDVADALKKGDLKLQLQGVKLKGSWALIRTKGGDGRSWLLIKHRDEWAGPVDIATFAPLSIKSGGDFTDILEQESPDLWTSNRAAKGGSAHMLKVVERAVAIAEENKKASGGREDSLEPPEDGKLASKAKRPKPKAATTASAPARSTPRTPAASGRAVRSRATRSRPR